MNKKGFINVAIVLIVVVLVGGFSYWALTKEEVSTNELPPIVPTVTPPTSVTLPDTSTWQTYRNEEYGFEFRYPSDMMIEVGPAIDPNYGTPPYPIDLYLRNQSISLPVTIFARPLETISPVFKDVTSLEDYRRVSEELCAMGNALIEQDPSSGLAKCTVEFFPFVTAEGVEGLGANGSGEGGSSRGVSFLQNETLYSVGGYRAPLGDEALYDQIAKTFQFLDL